MATPRWKRDRLEWARKNRRRLDLLVAERTPADLRELSRDDAIEALLEVVAAWEALTGRSQDLPRERLDDEPTHEVKAHLAWYGSEEARALMARELVDLVRQLL